MFNIFSAIKRNKELEHECVLLKNEVVNLKYQLNDAKEVDKFHAESERRAWESRDKQVKRADGIEKKSKELKDRLEAFKSQLREQSDADLMLLALQKVGLVLSKGAVDKFVSDEELANDSVRKRMISKGVESPLDDLRRSDNELLHLAHSAALASRYGDRGDGGVLRTGACESASQYYII